MPAKITNKLRTLSARSFFEKLQANTKLDNLFVFISNSEKLDAETKKSGGKVSVPVTDYEDVKDARDNMLAMVKVDKSNLSLACAMYQWKSGEFYASYDDEFDYTGSQKRIDLCAMQNQPLEEYLKVLSVTTLPRKPDSNSDQGAVDNWRSYKSRYYVLTKSFKIFICLSAPLSPSVIEPTYTEGSSDSKLIQTSDGYLWYYLDTLDTNRYINFYNKLTIPLRESVTDYALAKRASRIFAYDVVKDPSVSETPSIAVSSIDELQLNFYRYVNGVRKDLPVESTHLINSKGTSSGAIKIWESENGTKTISINIGVSQVLDFGYRDIQVELVKKNSGSFTVLPQYKVRPIYEPIFGVGNNLVDHLNAQYVIISSELVGDMSGSFPVNIPFNRLGLLYNPTIAPNLKTSNHAALNTGSTSPDTSSNLLFVSDGSGNQMGSCAMNTIDGLTSAPKIGGYIYLKDSSTGTDQKIAKIISTINENDTYVLRYVYISGSDDSVIDCKDDLTVDILQDLAENSTGTPKYKYDTVSGSPVPFIQSIKGTTSTFDRYTGEVIYLENRTPVTRSSDQTEDVKIVLEF